MRVGSNIQPQFQPLIYFESPLSFPTLFNRDGFTPERPSTWKILGIFRYLDHVSFLLPLSQASVQDKKTRDKAIKNLSGFLSNNSQEPLPNSELAKLWKGLFYCMSFFGKGQQGSLCTNLPTKFEAIGCLTSHSFNKHYPQSWRSLCSPFLLRLHRYHL